MRIMKYSTNDSYVTKSSRNRVCITVSTETNCCKLTSKEVRESWSPHTLLAPLVAAPVLVEGGEK